MTAYTLKVKPDPLSSLEWTKPLNHEEYEEVVGKLNGRACRGIFFSLAMPVRTQNFKDFSKDFFFPTVVNRALKVQNIVLKIFAVLFSIVLDLSTIWIRALLLIPRLVWNGVHSREKHPFHQYLKMNIEDKSKFDLLKVDSPFVRIEHVDADRSRYSEEWKDGFLYRKYQNAMYWEEQGVQLIEMPRPAFDVKPETGSYPL